MNYCTVAWFLCMTAEVRKKEKKKGLVVGVAPCDAWHRLHAEFVERGCSRAGRGPTYVLTMCVFESWQGANFDLIFYICISTTIINL